MHAVEVVDARCTPMQVWLIKHYGIPKELLEAAHLPRCGFVHKVVF